MHSKIAIIGMSGLFPGSSNTEEFWRKLLAGEVSIGASTAEDFGADPSYFYDPQKGAVDRCYALNGGYIRDFHFNPNGYYLPSDFLLKQDKLYQWALHVSKEALNNSGYAADRDSLSRCGVILGELSFPTQSSHKLLGRVYANTLEKALGALFEEDSFVVPPHHGIMPDNDILTYTTSEIIKKALGLGGNHYSLDAACASTLYAIKMACDELVTGKADLMLAGAVCGSDQLFIHMGFSIFQAYAEQGSRFAPLDKQTAGLVSSEGAGMLVLKRLTDAVEAGDTILAVIEGIGLSNDGKGKFLLSPNPEGQRIALERAYASPYLDPSATTFIECHATGTPLGDRTELSSIARFFEPYRVAPLLGAVKANVGHLLTAASIPAIMKVILSMQEKQIPATPGIEDPLVVSEGSLSPDQIITKSTSWDPEVKQAGVNAFGFGGTNAHLVLKSFDVSNTPTSAPLVPMKPIAITGMAIHCAQCKELDEFYQTIYTGDHLFTDLPEKRWKGFDADQELLKKFGFKQGAPPQGAYIDGFDVDLLRFKIHPKELETMEPQQALILKVADQALKDAGFLPREKANVAVLIAMESELAIHHYLARWDMSWQLQEALKQSGIVLSDEQYTELEDICKNIMFSRQGAQTPSQHTSFVGNIMASRISALWDLSGPSFTISCGVNSAFKAMEVAQNLLSMREVEAVVVGSVDFSGGLENVLLQNQKINNGNKNWLPGEGAGAIVLKRLEEVGEDKVYAVVEKVGEGDAFWSEDFDYLELTSPNGTDQLLSRTQKQKVENAIAVGSVQKNVGFTFAASGMISLIKTAMCLQHRFLPSSASWPGSPSALTAPFYTPAYSRPWILREGLERRNAIVAGENGAYIKLSESLENIREDAPFLKKNFPFLFPIQGDTVEQLLLMLKKLDERLYSGENAADLSVSCFHAFEGKKDSGFQLCLMAKNTRDLRQELLFFQNSLQNSIERGQDLKTPKGSFFTSRPLGKRGKIAFVYPGSSTAYEGLGKDLFQLFPELHRFFAQKLPSIAPYIQEDYLYPKISSSSNVGPDIQQDVIAMMTSGILFSTAYTQILRSQFKLNPDIAFGYSMGECSSMWFATGVWEGLNAEHTLRKSGVFSRRIAGELEAVAELWGVSTLEVRDKWRSYVVLAPVEEIKAGMAGRERIYLTFINTEEEVVISGDKAICLALIHEMGRPYFEIPFQNAIHHDFCRKEEDGLLSIHSYPISTWPEISFFSSIDLAPIRLKSSHIAQNAKEVCCRTVDFPRTVKGVYDQGARIFIEVGPQSTCSTWIGKILHNHEHVAIPFNLKGKSDADNLAAVLASLISHGVELDLSFIFDQATTAKKETKHFEQTLALGGERVFDTLLTADNRKKFQPIRKKEIVVEVKTGSQDYAHVVSESSKHKEPAFATANHTRIISTARPVSTIEEKNSTLMNQQDKVAKLPVSVNGKSRIGENGLRLQDYASGEQLKGKEIIFSQTDLEEFAGGKIANVFGKAYGDIDSYRRIVRLPMHPYLLVSRVTKLNAQLGVYEPCSIQTEYDIPYQAWYTTDGQIPWAVAVESGQCDLLLISYLGIDFENKGERVYRLLDCTLTFVDDFPYEGQTLRYDISINSFVRHGDNLLFFFSYRCYVEDRLFLKMDGGCAGFFSDEDLAAGKGVIYSEKELEARRNADKKRFIPFLQTNKTSFSKEELNFLIDGQPHQCFESETYFPNGRNSSLRLPPRQILMLDRVIHVDTQGGAYGLGSVTAEKDLSPDDWYFPCHFKDDEVLAGSLVAEGGGNLLRFYMLMLGLQCLTKDARFQPVYDLPQKVRVRRQINKDNKKLTYKLEVKDIGLVPNPYVIADLEILVDGVAAVHFENLGLQIREKSTPRYLDKAHDVALSPRSKGALLNEKDISIFALGSLEEAFGPDFSVYNGRSVSRQPNTDLQFISRVLSIDGQRKQFNRPSTIVAEYDVPDHIWYYDQNTAPTMPYSVLMEIALQPCGLLGAYLGSTLQFPDKNLFFRNLDGEGTLCAWPKGTDFRGKTILNKAILVSSVAMGGTVLQNYSFELSIDEVMIYKGTASFGFFPADALSQQVGLDKGQPTQPWYILEHIPEEHKQRILLDPKGAGAHWFEGPSEKPHYRLAGDQLHLIDEVIIMENRGKYGQGYVYAEKKVRNYDWFFTCHFYTDPVMPGSLGVEAMLEALQAWALKTGLGKDLPSPRFVQLENHHTSWKYRGQILQSADKMKLEVHVKKVEKRKGGITVLADASLWNGETRIYEVTDLGLGIESNSENTVLSDPAIDQQLIDTTRTCFVATDSAGNVKICKTPDLGQGLELLAVAKAISARDLGSAAFRKTYGIEYAYITGAMANGIASEELVIAMGKAGFMGSFGAAGLPPQRIAEAIDKIQNHLPTGPYAFNLIHSPNEEALESEGVRLFLEKGVKVVEASAFLGLTRHIVHYRVAGLYQDGKGKLVIGNKVIAKVSRREVAHKFMSPPPADLLQILVSEGKISAEQAQWAVNIPMADDITVEADSGGHTDNRPLVSLLPSIIALRDEIQKIHRYIDPIRIGAAGGISTPQSALAAFMMGADYVVTGSVNQSCIEAGTSPYVRQALAKATMTDVSMAPAADMFEMGVELQVLKKGSLFPMRAKKLYEYYRQYVSIDEIPLEERDQLEKQIFRKSLDEIWKDCIAFFEARDPAQITRAENDPHRKMALIFRWYLGLSSHWANTGTPGRELDYQIWCGPSMGAFNEWVKGSYLEKSENRRAAEVARHIMQGAAYFYRLRNLRLQGLEIPMDWEKYTF